MTFNLLYLIHLYTLICLRKYSLIFCNPNFLIDLSNIVFRSCISLKLIIYGTFKVTATFESSEIFIVPKYWLKAMIEFETHIAAFNYEIIRWSVFNFFNMTLTFSTLWSSSSKFLKGSFRFLSFEMTFEHDLSTQNVQ